MRIILIQIRNLNWFQFEGHFSRRQQTCLFQTDPSFSNCNFWRVQHFQEQGVRSRAYASSFNTINRVMHCEFQHWLSVRPEWRAGHSEGNNLSCCADQPTIVPRKWAFFIHNKTTLNLLSKSASLRLWPLLVSKAGGLPLWRGTGTRGP